MHLLRIEVITTKTTKSNVLIFLFQGHREGDVDVGQELRQGPGGGREDDS